MNDSGDLRYPSIDGLRAFEAAARLGSFERAADALSVTASAVGKRIATLEDLIGGELFQRGGKTLVLTATGREYLEQVRPALGLLAAMPQHQRASQRAPKLRVSSPPTFARQILVPQLEGFTAMYPDIELEVVLSIPYVDQRPGEADVEILHGDAAGLGGRELMRDVVIPMAAPALLQRLPPMRVPADLATATLLRTPIEPWAPWFRAAGLAWPEPVSGPKLVDLGLTLEAAVGGQGVALGRPSLARPWLERGSLQPLFNITAVPAHQYIVIHGQAGTPAVFADWLAGCCQGLSATALALVSGPA